MPRSVSGVHNLDPHFIEQYTAFLYLSDIILAYF